MAQITTIFAITSPVNGSTAARIAVAMAGFGGLVDEDRRAATRATRARAFAVISAIDWLRRPSASNGAIIVQARAR